MKIQSVRIKKFWKLTETQLSFPTYTFQYKLYCTVGCLTFEVLTDNMPCEPYFLLAGVPLAFGGIFLNDKGAKPITETKQAGLNWLAYMSKCLCSLLLNIFPAKQIHCLLDQVSYTSVPRQICTLQSTSRCLINLRSWVAHPSSLCFEVTCPRIYWACWHLEN